jgi:hypothetical protein
MEIPGCNASHGDDGTIIDEKLQEFRWGIFGGQRKWVKEQGSR